MGAVKTNKNLLGYLYNLDSFEDLTKSHEAKGFKDSAGGIVLARNLEYIDPEIFEQEFPDVTFTQSGVLVNNSGGYAKAITKLKRGKQGGFTNVGDNASNKGKITVTGEDDTIPVIEREAFSEWTDTEVQQADLENINLVSDFIEAHNEEYNRDLDEIFYTGTKNNDGTQRSEGLLNYSGFTATAATGAIGTLTGEEQYDAIASLITRQRTAVSNVQSYSATHVVMPTRVYNTISETILNSAGSAQSVLSALKANFPDVTFMMTFRAEDGGTGGASATVAFSSNRKSMQMRVPHQLEVGEIIKTGSFKFHVDSKYRIAGLDIAENGAGEILTGL